jgi:predicted dehydrogenase
VARSTDYTRRRIPETSPARAVLDIGIHWADLAGFVMNCPIRRLYARMHIHHPVRIDPEIGNRIHVKSDDTTSIMVEFADGTPGNALFSKCMLGHNNDLSLTVSGDRQELRWQQEQCDRLLIGNRETGNETVYMDRLYSHPDAAPFITMPPGHAPGWQDAQKNGMLAFYSSLEESRYLHGNVPYATFADGIMGNRFVDAVLASARENRWIDL